MTAKTICLGQIGAAHGIQGHVRVKPFTGEPEALGDYGALTSEDGATKFKIASLRPIKGGMLVVKFKGVPDRTAAEALNGTKLYVARDILPELDDDDDFYVEDLIGLDVRDENDTKIGTVLTVQDFGAGDLLDVKPPRGPSLLIPFTKDAVPIIDIESGYVGVNLAAAGLKDNGDDDAERAKEEGA